jgi:hypothetical protein
MDTRSRVKKALAKYAIVEDDVINSKINSAATGVGLNSAYIDIEVKKKKTINILNLDLTKYIHIVYW